MGKDRKARTVMANDDKIRVVISSILLLLSVILGACGQDEGQTVSTARDSLGVETIQHRDLANYEGMVYRPEVLFEVGGTVDGPAQLLFGRVGGVDVLVDGTVGVLDLYAGEIRTFRPNGSFVRRLSQKGTGPGEISGEGAFGLIGTGADFFVIPDVSNQTVTLLRSDGEVMASQRWDIGASFTPEWRAGIDTLLAVRISSRENEILVQRSASGEMLDTLATVPTVPRPGDDLGDRRWPFWQDHLIWSVNDTGYVVAARMSESSFTVYRDGRPIRMVSWTDRRKPLSEDQLQSLVGIVARSTDGGKIPPSFRSQFRLPDRLPAMADIEIAEGGLIMVQRVRPVEFMDQRVTHLYRAMGFGGAVWDLFSVEGDYWGAIDIGAPNDVFAIRGDTILGVRESELGVQQVFLARIPEGIRVRLAR